MAKTKKQTLAQRLDRLERAEQCRRYGHTFAIAYVEVVFNWATGRNTFVVRKTCQHCGEATKAGFNLSRRKGRRAFTDCLIDGTPQPEPRLFKKNSKNSKEQDNA